MKRLVFAVLSVVIILSTPVFAQQAGDNINVLPVYSDPFDPEAHLKGDGYLQRQVEPTIAASTRNPDHLLAFFNDYRAVDVANDSGLGEAEQVALLLNTSRIMMAAVPWLQIPKVSLAPIASVFEAWVGMSRSYDGGITWSGGFMPGAPFDNTTVGQASPVSGLDAATDPVIVAGPCGKFYVVFVAFTRGGESKMVVARYEDLNNEEGGDTLVYDGMTILESGNNATNGYFLDKPHINLDVWRGPGAADQCAHRVYVSYSTFNGNDANGNFRSKINFAKSEDGGETFSVTKIQQPYNQNQGSFITVDPQVGTPKTTGGGTVYMVWRHFGDPDTVLMSRTLDYGKKWSKIVELTGDTPMAPFDQPTVPTAAVNDPGLISFRSNGFPTAAVTADGTLFAAWQERVNISVPDTDPAFGKPDELGSPRIVLTSSLDGGETWSERQAADFTSRQEPFDPVLLAELGELPGEPLPAEPIRPSGPQVMPKLSFGGGRLMLAYYESRGLIGTDVGSGEEVVQPADVNPISKFISGYDRVLDLRAALLDPTTGDVLSTSQVSRYPISLGADLTDGQDLADVAPVNAPCSPDFGEGLAPCVRQVNRANAPQSGAGTSPFIGDYIDLVPTLQFVNDGGVWRWATDAEDVPFQGFHAIFVDNRHLVPPTLPEGSIEWLNYPNYGPPGIGGACFNAGSRNTDVLTSKVASLIVSAPTTYKQLDARRGFPLTVRNPTDSTRYYWIEIIEGNSYATFSVDPGQPYPEERNVDAGEVEIFAYSSISQMVYIDAQATGQVKVRISELTGPNGSIKSGGQTGTVILNADPNQPAVQDLDPVENPTPTIGDAFVINPVPDNAFVINDGEENAFVINPFVDNAFVINDSEENAFVINAFVINAFVINAFVINQSIYDVVDTTWTVTASGADTSASYLPMINIDNAEQFLGNYAFQLIVDKTTSHGTFAGDDAACAAYAMSQQQVVSNVTQDPADVENAFVINPAPANAFVINAFPENAFVINSTFTMAPSDAPTLTKAVPVDDGTLKAPRASDVVKVTLRAYQLVPDSALPIDPGTGKPFKYNPDRSKGGDEPAFSLVATSCTDPECLISNSPDLVPSAVGATPVEIEAGASFDSPAWTLSNEGSSDAIAEVRNLRHGFFLSKDQTVQLDQFSDEPIGGDLRIGFVPSSSNTVAANDSVSIDAGTGGNLTVPSDVVPGDYYLVLFADDFREVSEKDEPNNQIAFAITILEPNDPPVATGITPTIDEDTPLEGTLEASDPNNDDLTYDIVTFPSQGDLTLDTGTGAFTYTPDLDTSGTDFFTFTVSDGKETSNEATVSITIKATNDTPQVGDVSVTVNEDGSAEGFLEVFDPDNDINSLEFNVVSGPANGSVVFPDPNEANAFTYTPDPDFNGDDQFTVTVSDGSSTSDGATVTITINSVNDKPVADDAVLTTDEDTDLVATVTASDVDEDGLTYTLVSGPSNGTLSAESLPSFTYSPNTDFNGSDSFTFVANDGTIDSAPATVTITVSPVNDAPTANAITTSGDEDTAVAITLGGSDIDENSLTFSVTAGPTNGTLSCLEADCTYTPNANFNGSDSFTFVANDGDLSSAAATVSITVNPVNDAPTANSDAAIADEDATISVILTGEDIDGDALTFAIVAGPTAGTLGGTAPNLTYTPNADSTVPDSFTFVANDGTVNSALATISISINALNDPPVAGDDVITVLENSGITSIEPSVLLTGDTDIDGLTLSVSGATAVADGVCTTAGTVSFDLLTQTTSYTPPPNFESTDCFAYSIEDGAGGTDVGLVTVIVDGQVPDWDFVGFAKPWRNNYRINAGSGFPLKWYYEDRATETVADSSLADPVIHIYGPLASCGDPIGADTPEVIEDTGSSDLRYNDGDWQFNWDTVGLGLGCYKIQVESRYTLQNDGPFTVILK